MTDEQKRFLIKCYNETKREEERACDKLDSASEKTFAKHSSDHSFAIGTLRGIALALTMLDFEIILDDEENAIDIVPTEE